MATAIELELQYGAKDYDPLPVILCKGEGAYVWDDKGKRYLDMMSAYSAVSHGHCHPRLVKVLHEQAQSLTITSRAYFSDTLGPFLQRLCEITGMDQALPMNTGAEAVETALKVARKWAYTVKGVPENKAEIIACQNNFHGRTITIVGMSSEPQYRFGFGPFPEGFKTIPFGDIDALASNINENTAAFLVEPIQGEGGIIVPPEGYLKQAAELCKKNNVLLLCDEIQTGLGRTGKLFASDHDDVKPDGLILGKALGGGMMPVSMFLSSNEVMDVITPGDHGSTFGGNPLGSRVAHEALDILVEEDLVNRSAELGAYFKEQLQAIDSPLIKEIRGKGLFIGIEVDTEKANARELCLQLLAGGLLSKETHATVIRLSPPLVISKAQIDDALQIITSVFCIHSRDKVS